MTIYRKLTRFVVTSLLLAPLASLAAGPGVSASRPDSSIVWNKWTPDSFARAKSGNKMLLINVGIEVCFACRWMEEFTYRDPQVATLVMEHFIPIQVDADAQPDIGERYSDWAWPATIFMAPDGTQVLAIRGSRRPPRFLPVLQQLIAQHAKGELKPDALAPYAAAPEPEITDLTEIRSRIRQHLDDDFDDRLGGWSDELKEIEGSGNIIHLFYRAQAEGDRQSERRALKTAYAMLGRIDPVWGGFYAAGYEGWASPIPEKRTGAQATALEVFAYAYHLTRDPRFLKAARDVDRYLRAWMQAPDGTFYTSQKDMPPRLPEGWTTQQYFALNTDARRRRYGVPPIDHAVYTDLNARVVVAYTHLYEATGDEVYLRAAERCARALLAARQQPEGWVLHVTDNPALGRDERIHLKSIQPRPYLRSQAHFGVALLALHKVSGDKVWLEAALRLADAMAAKLEDRKAGGFYASVSDGVATVVPQRKPLQDNGVAARFFYQLGRYTKKPEFIASAERAVRAVGISSMLEREGRVIGDLAVAAETVTAEYVEFTVVGAPKQADAQRLFATGRTYFEPRKLLHYEQPGRYPDLGKPAMFVCSQSACSVPIFESKDVAAQADKFHKRTVTGVD